MSFTGDMLERACPLESVFLGVLGWEKQREVNKEDARVRGESNGVNNKEFTPQTTRSIVENGPIQDPPLLVGKHIRIVLLRGNTFAGTNTNISSSAETPSRK